MIDSHTQKHYPTKLFYIFGAVCALLLTISCSKPASPTTTNTATTTNTNTATTTVASPPSESYPTLAKQAKEVSEALSRKDYGRVIDLTYPKAVETAGGREKMLAGMKEQLKSMSAQGVELLSTDIGPPTQILHDGGNVYAVVPVSLKVKAQDGIFQSEGNMIGISQDGGANWTFIDASGKTQQGLRALLPNVIDKLVLAPDKPPVKIADNPDKKSSPSPLPSPAKK